MVLDLNLKLLKKQRPLRQARVVKESGAYVSVECN